MIDQGARESIPDDRHGDHPLAFHGAPDVVWIQTLDFILNDHRPADMPHIERHPMRGPMHERRCGQSPNSLSTPDLIQERRKTLGRLPRKRSQENIFLSPEHALGHARGAAGIQDIEVVLGQGPGRRRLRGGQSLFIVERPG